MSWQTSQFSPEQRVIDRVIDLAIVPTLARFERDVRTSMTARFAVFLYDEMCWAGLVGSSGVVRDTAEPVRGNIRVRFRKTRGEARGMYFVEAIYHGVAEHTGFSGFTCNGRLRLQEPDPVTAPETVTTRYNVCEWQGPR